MRQSSPGKRVAGTPPSTPIRLWTAIRPCSIRTGGVATASSVESPCAERRKGFGPLGPAGTGRGNWLQLRPELARQRSVEQPWLTSRTSCTGETSWAPYRTCRAAPTEGVRGAYPNNRILQPFVLRRKVQLNSKQIRGINTASSGEFWRIDILFPISCELSYNCKTDLLAK